MIRLVRHSLLLLASIFYASQTASAQQNFTVESGGARIDASLDENLPHLSQDQLKHWVKNAADAVVAYYGHAPVPHIDLRLRALDGDGVRGGRTFSMHGGLIRIGVGRDSTESDLATDWMLTHEMVHLTFPSVPDEHHWIEEGIATYVEPIARVQAGQLSASRMWFEVVRDMPKGLPQSGDAGLDHTHTWGRTYWGGALFCFLAEIEIRKQTHNQKGLQDALRGILESGGDMRQEWDLIKALEAGDRAVGGNALIILYNKMKDQPSPVSLDPVWKDLGITIAGDSVQFQDDAPLAAVRKSITAPRAAH